VRLTADVGGGVRGQLLLQGLQRLQRERFPRDLRPRRRRPGPGRRGPRPPLKAPDSRRPPAPRRLRARPPRRHPPRHRDRESRLAPLPPPARSEQAEARPRRRGRNRPRRRRESGLLRDDPRRRARPRPDGRRATAPDRMSTEARGNPLNSERIHAEEHLGLVRHVLRRVHRQFDDDELSDAVLELVRTANDWNAGRRPDGVSWPALARTGSSGRALPPGGPPLQKARRLEVDSTSGARRRRPGDRTAGNGPEDTALRESAARRDVRALAGLRGREAYVLETLRPRSGRALHPRRDRTGARRHARARPPDRTEGPPGLRRRRQPERSGP
jgi:hypothetical protein